MFRLSHNEVSRPKVSFQINCNLTILYVSVNKDLNLDCPARAGVLPDLNDLPTTRLSDIEGGRIELPFLVSDTSSLPLADPSEWRSQSLGVQLLAEL